MCYWQNVYYLINKLVVFLPTTAKTSIGRVIREYLQFCKKILEELLILVFDKIKMADIKKTSLS